MTSEQISRAIDCVALAEHTIAVVFAKDLKSRVRATRKYKTRRAIEIVVTIGPLNYKERELVKHCKKAKARVPGIWFPKG